MLASFCGLLTVQVGIAVLSGVFLTLAGVIFTANVFDTYNHGGWPISLILMIIFVLGMSLVGVLMVASSYSEKRSLALAGFVILIILILYWLVLSLMSFFSGPDTVGHLCIHLRCPETFWLANLLYRAFHKDEYMNMYYGHPPTTKKTPPEQPAWWPSWSRGKDQSSERRRRSSYDAFSADTRFNNSFEAKKLVNINPKDASIKESIGSLHYRFDNEILKNGLHNHNMIEYSTSFPSEVNSTMSDTNLDLIFLSAAKDQGTDEGDKEKDAEETGHLLGFPLLGAVLLFVINLIFLVFSALMLWSWASELDYADYYVDEEESDYEEPIIIYTEE